MLLGMSLMAMEWRYQLLTDRIGIGGRWLVFVTGGWLSVWGLKDVIAAAWPELGNRHRWPRRHRFLMPVEGFIYVVVMVVLFVGSLLGHSNPLMLMFALLAGPFIVSGGRTFSMLRGLSVKRVVPPRVMAGEPFSVEVQLKNPKRWVSAWLMTVRDRVDNSREFLNPEILFIRVRTRSTETGRYQLKLSQRGQYKFGPLQVNSRFPLGLVERGLILAESDTILVYPPIGRMSSGWRRRLQTANQLVAHARARVGSFHDDFHRIREYRSGDEPRSIHWRTTARRNELMVREYRESRDRHLIVLLDAWLPDRPTFQQRARLEYAISLAATMTLDHSRNGRGSDVFFAVHGTTLREWGGSTRTKDIDLLLDLLALVQPSNAADPTLLVQTARRERTPHTRTILVTPFAERIETEAWAAMDADIALSSSWSDPPQVIVADPNELGEIFSLEQSVAGGSLA